MRALHYRVWIFIVGLDTEWRAVGSPEDSDFTLTRDELLDLVHNPTAETAETADAGDNA